MNRFGRGGRARSGLGGLARALRSRVRTSRHSPEPPDDGASWRSSYAPHADGRPDPGEVVWAWVPYEEDPSQGKDRPVLVLAVGEGQVVALQLTSKDHDRDADQEARAGRVWMDIGSGAWDSRGRPSEVRLNRVLHLPAGAVRREGAALDRSVFDQVLGAAAPYL